MNNKTSWVKSPWTVSIATTLLLPALTFLRDFLKSLPILSTLKSMLAVAGKYVVIFFYIDIKVWWILSFLALIVLVLFLIDRFQTPTSQPLQKPDFCSYKSGKLKKWRWTWDWYFNTSKRAWMIKDLTAHCSDCGTPMIENHDYIYGTSFVCPRCDYSSRGYGYKEDSFKIERIILDNINRGILK